MESENIKTIEAEIKAAQKRVEAAKKSGELKALDAYIKKYLEEKGQRIANQTAVDGKPLSDGEIALVKALRKTWGFAEILKPGDAVVVTKAENGEYISTTYNISFMLIEGDGSNTEVVNALELISEEHKEENRQAMQRMSVVGLTAAKLYQKESTK